MCNPYAAGGTSAGLGILQAFSAFTGANRAYRANSLAAVDAFRDDVVAIQDQIDQSNRNASENALTTEIAALEARGKAIAQSAGTGLADISLGDTLQNVSQRKYRSQDINELNRKNAERQGGRELKAAGARANARINSVQAGSMTQLAFGVAKAVTDGATTYAALGK